MSASGAKQRNADEATSAFTLRMACLHLLIPLTHLAVEGVVVTIIEVVVLPGQTSITLEVVVSVESLGMEVWRKSAEAAATTSPLPFATHRLIRDETLHIAKQHRSTVCTSQR